MKRSSRIGLGLLIALMALIILAQSAYIYFYRQAVDDGVRDGMWGEWYYAQPSGGGIMMCYDFGSTDYPIYADDLRQLEKILHKAFPDYLFFVPNPADFGYITHISLRKVGTPELSVEQRGQVDRLILQWQQGIMSSREPREPEDVPPVKTPAPAEG